VALHPEIRRTLVFLGIGVGLVILLHVFKPQSRQFVDLRLTSGGAPAASVEVKFTKPGHHAPARCDGRNPGVIGANPAFSSADGTLHLRRRISPDPLGTRRSDWSVKAGTWLMAVCAKVDGNWVRVWEGAPDEARRFLRLDCELGTRRCQAQFARQLDETLRPVIVGVGLGLWALLLVGGNRGSIGWGTTRLGAQCFFYPLVQAHAAWLHGFPWVSKGVAVALLVWAGYLLYRIAQWHLDQRRWHREHRQRLS
jgi:hypothetical protein